MTQRIIGRTILVVLIISLLFGAGFSQSISGNKINNINRTYIGLEAATKVAFVKLTQLGKTDYTITDSITISTHEGIPLFYIFDLQPQGYIVVTGYYDLPPVIAYSFTNNFQSDDLENNIFLELLKADLELRLQDIPLLPEAMITERHNLWETFLSEKPEQTTCQNFEQWPPEGSTPTGGWLLTNWHQSAPYNNYCPLDLIKGGRSVAGCPAVAMAQILNYHNTTNGIVFTDSDDYHHIYGGNNYWIDNDHDEYNFPSFPVLNTYLETLSYNYQNQNPPTNNDKAAITFACGVAAKQVYGKDGSGTFGVDQAYDAYLRFNCTTIEMFDDDVPELYERLSNNMKDAIPAHLAIVNPDWTMGHNVVVDGYNTDDYYHINFGWGGSYNGWYLIPEEIPYGLTVIEGVIVDILKENESNEPILSCDGTLHWINVEPGATVTGNISVENIGDAGSKLDWTITEWPEWGNWVFAPSNGSDLTPEHEPVTVQVSVIAPEEKNQEFIGSIKIINTENTNNYCVIPVSLVTPKTKSYSYIELFHSFFDNFPNAFPIMRLLLDSYRNYQ
jgi:hypothetical protein